MSLPLSNSDVNSLSMSLSYWTLKKETKDCVIDAYECRLDEYDQYLEGELSLSNVQTSAWQDTYD